MKNSLPERRADGYRETIRLGLEGLRRGGNELTQLHGSTAERVQALREALDEAEAVAVGAGAGVSTAAGLEYSGARFERYFSDFRRVFGITDMYSGGFFPFPDERVRWAWWSRHIYFNRYVDAPLPVYPELLKLLAGKDFFVITTNVDSQFARSGFAESRLFCTQGDYGLFQQAQPKVQETYGNEAWVNEALAAQGFVKNAAGVFDVPEDGKLTMILPPDLVPRCPDGSEAAVNLRSDDTFVEDEAWHRASEAYAKFLIKARGRRVLYLELGVGLNTPVIIKYPFWELTYRDAKARYACVNLNEACCPERIAARSVCIKAGIAQVLGLLQQ